MEAIIIIDLFWIKNFQGIAIQDTLVSRMNEVEYTYLYAIELIGNFQFRKEKEREVRCTEKRNKFTVRQFIVYQQLSYC